MQTQHGEAQQPYFTFIIDRLIPLAIFIIHLQVLFKLMSPFCIAYIYTFWTMELLNVSYFTGNQLLTLK